MDYTAHNHLKASKEPAHVQASRDQLHARWAARKAQEDRTNRVGRAVVRTMGLLVVVGILYHVGASMHRAGMLPM